MSTPTPELEKKRWREYFDSLAHSLQGLLVSIEVMSEQIGDQTDVERIPLQGISYDPKDDVLEVAVGGRDSRYPVVLRHFIDAPSMIRVQDGAVRPHTIFVEDASGTKTLIRLFEVPAIEA